MVNAMTVDEVAIRCHVKPRTVREWIRQGKLSASRIGKNYLIEEQDLSRAFAESRYAKHPLSTERIDSIQKMRGALKETGISTERFMREKQEETEREERKFERGS